MVAALRSEFGPLPDQSMHEKTSVVDLIEEIYVSLRQADEVAINDLFKALKTARDAGDQVAEQAASSPPGRRAAAAGLSSQAILSRIA